MQEMVSEEQQIITIILIAISLLVLMSIAIVLFFYFSRRRITKTELEKANLEIEHQKEVLRSTIITQEEERKRIAQDMHDAISSKLNVVSLNANMLLEANIAAAETNKIADSILKVTTTVLESSRKIAYDLLPPTLHKFGLVASLEELCDEVNETGKFKVKFKFNYAEKTLLSDEELHLFRIAQELFNNAIKHSEATTLKLGLFSEENLLKFHYKDDGKGFLLSEARNAKGLGISGIENRAAILNAHLNIETAPGEGLFVEITKVLH